MSDIRRNADRNRAIQAMMTDGEQLKTFYRFVANNPHIALHDACQIVIERPNASVCFSFEEWNAQGRRVTKGRKGIPYYDSNGNKYFVFDVADTHGENRYRRTTQPVKKILDGLDLLNGTEIAESNRGDYRIMLSGVVTYLGQNDFLTENDEIRNRLIAEGVAYSLYSTTGFPKERGITLKGYPYGLQENADLFREVQKAVEVLQQDINDAIYNKQNEVPVIDDIDEEYVSDEPVIPKADEQPVAQEEKSTILPYYAEYLRVQKANPDSIVVYRLGDFYEVIGEKAEQAATILDLTLTGRNVGLPERVPMCGFPYHVTEQYIEKLLDKVSVVVVEPDKEPVFIKSHVEEPKMPELVELSPEESEELDRIFSEQEETEEQPDYVGEIDTRFPIDDDYGDEDEPTEEEIEEAFEAAKAEESDEETEDYDYEEDKKQTKETKPENRGKPIWERRNRPSMQRSLFDAFDEQTPEEKLKEWGLKRGSGFEYGKYRIYEKYQENPTDKEFSDFLRREYGTGGGGYDDEIWTDGKGMKLRHRDRENPENEVGMILKWEQVAYGIADLIDEDKYFDDKESEEYIAFLSERRGTDENRVKAIARHIAEDGVKRNENGERTTFLSWRYADYKFCKDHAAEIEKALNACPEVDAAKIDGDKVEITVKEAYRRYSEQPSEKPIRDLDSEEDEEWENRIESGEITQIEPVGESTKESNTDLTKIGFEQSELGARYDMFVKRFGYINSKNNLRLFKPDGDSALLFACENVSDDEETVTKADVFTKRTIRPYTAVTSTDDCFEALQISKNERGSVDISYIEELTKKDYDTVLAELGNAVFRNPVAVNPEDKYSGFETAEEYLSGRVVDKLQAAERMKQSNPDLIDYDKNISALREVQPSPVRASDIAVRVGTSWIDKELYKEFFCELIGMPYYYRDGVELYYNKHDGSWRIDRTQYARNYGGMNVTSVYGTNRANAYRLFEDCLNQRSTQIYDTVLDADGREKRVLNNSETVAAREKQNKIVEAFKDWIFKDPQRRDELETIYNRLFNQIRLPKYDGSYLRFPEMNPAIELRPHQKDAVHRIITSGNTLLHHIVGSGKTFTICAAAMKLRQYGLAKKPMIAVPNHLVQQWANSFRELYPTAKLLIATKDDLDKDHREQFVSKVAMGDWDSVIIAQSSFAKINISPERQIAKIQEEIAAIERSIEMQWEDSNSPSGSVKNLERIKKGREAQLKKLLDESKKDNVLIFEKLGVDYLFVDEADAYKNLFLYTKMNNVAGISNAASARASDLQLKIEYINELHGGDKGVVFATGTPISNSMTEMYTMQTYLQKRTLEKLGIDYFDAWAADFGETVTALELAPSGKGYRARTRFAKFTNLPELLTLYHSFADVKTDVKLDVPEVERKVITLKPSDTVINLTEEIAKRADAIYAGGVDPHIDNMLKVTGDGKKLALDPRCIDPLLSDESGSKLNYCADNVYEEWKNSTDIKGTQLVFCDLSTPKKPYSEYVYGTDFDAYNDLKHKLVERGIPETEIAFIHDANTDKAKQDLFDKVTAGTIRVLIGSTEKCGAGTNVQERLVAIHHLDAPYRPRDLIQRDGRGIRQGNRNKIIRIYTYAEERTFDSYSYQILETKQRFISQVEKGDMTVREADDIDEATLSYAEIKAITSANPKIKRKMELDMEMARLRDLESRYKKELFALQDKVRKEFPEQIQRQELYLERVRKDVELVKDKYNPERFEINVGGTVYADSVEDGKKNGGLALMDALFHNKTGTAVAEYCGFKISLNPIELLSNERSITLSGAGQYKMDIGESASGNLTRLENFVKEFAAREERAVKRLESTKADFEVAKEQVKVPFEHKDKIMELNTELSELNAELDLNKREEVVIDDEESGDEPVTAETEDNYMALPPKRTETKTRTNKKKTMEKLYKTYKQIETQNPGAMVFAVKNGDYTCFDDTTEELMALSSLSPSYFKAGEKEVKTLTIDETLFKEFASAFVSAGLKIALFDEPEEEKTFIDESDKVAAMQVDVLPDYTVSQEQMHEYGYTWDGMLPVRIRTARVLYGAGVELYRLGKDDTEGKVENGDFEDTESLYGVEKPAWEAFISSERGKTFLTAWHNVVESASEVVREDMSYLDGMYADSISDGFYEERIAIDRVLNGKYAPSEEAKPYIKPLLERYHKRFPLDILLEYYGWDYGDVYKALAENIPDAELREYATYAENEPVSVESPNYKEFVVNSIEKEFEEFKANLMSKSAEEIFQNNYEIHIKTELFDTLCGEYEDFGEEYYRALYEEVDHGGILQQLYDDFISSENASVSTGEDTIFFIKDYCEHYHSDVMKEFIGEEKSVYFGTDEEDTAYYYFKDGLGVDNLNRIKEQADEYIIAAPVLYMSQESLEDKNITFLKLGRDVDEAELKVNDEIAKFAMKAAYNKKLPLEATMISRNCGSDIEKGISTHFDGMHLNTDFIANLYALYGEERMNYVLANTVQMSDGDGRYSPGNKAWAKEFNINNVESDRRTFYVNSHPAVLDGFITAYRRYVKDFKEQLDKEENKEQMSENTRDYTKITARGDKVVNIEKDTGGRDIAIIDRTATMNKDYVVAIGYHTETGDWEQGRYGFESQEKAENWRKNEYGSERPKIEYIKINVANDAFIKKSGVGSVFKMPTNGEYAGFTYYMFNDKIRPSRQLVDLQSDSRELCYELSVRDDREIELRKGYGDNEQIVVLTAEEFKEAVGGATNKDYETQENTDTKWLNTSVPQEAFRKEYPKSMLFVLPNKQDFGGMSFFIPTAFVGEDKNSDDGRILIRLPDDFVIKAQSRDETREEALTAYDFNQLCNNTTAEDYKQAQAESAPGSETPSDWNYVSVPEKARIASFDESTLFRMPDGKYQDYTYYVPNKCVKENTEKGTIRLSLHNDYTVRLSDNSGEEKKTAELSAKDFCEEVRGKDAVAYGTEYKRPSVEANTSFDEKEKALRAAVPDEMKARPNWVVVKTWWNADKGKYNKRPVNCNSDKGEYAESDNPETWTTFDNALKYLKEKGGTTVAYALDGKDNISCIDLDHCYDENGQPSALAKEVLSKCGKTYVEKSVSGNGLHIFGKTNGMDIRTFSKDGDLEFYQKEHFIAMTGDGAGFYRLESFDTPEMKELLSRKCEKREEWKGVCKGVNGLSTMTDRDVVEKASNAKNGDKFKRLYAGEDLQNNHSNSDMSLMNLLAYWCNGDKEQMLRIFATSGLFRPNKSPDYYEGTAIKALRSMPVKSTYTPTIPKNTGGNGKR